MPLFCRLGGQFVKRLMAWLGVARPCRRKVLAATVPGTLCAVLPLCYAPCMPALITVDELLPRAPVHAWNDDISSVRALRRVQLGEYVSLAFENRASVLGTLRNIVSTEGMTDPAALQAECDVYNALLPVHGISAVLHVQVPETLRLGAVLHTLRGMETNLSWVLGTERRPAQFFGSLVMRQHIRFMLETTDVATFLASHVPMRLLVTLPHYHHEAVFTTELRRSLWEDLQ